jgi:YVTN family beta-propeller protein
MNLIAAGDGRFAISSDIGQHQWLYVIRFADGHSVSHLDFGRGSVGTLDAVGPEQERQAPEEGIPTKKFGLYYGLAVDEPPPGQSETVYAGMGAADAIAELTLSPDGVLGRAGIIHATKGDFPAGVALDQRGHLYVANNSSGAEPRKVLTPASMAVYDRQTRREIGRFVFSASYYGTSNFPYAISATADGTKCYVAAERDGIVYVLDTHDPAHIQLRAELATGSHPIALTFSPDHERLFVANSQSDTISTIDVAQDRITGTLLLRPPAARSLAGATPTAIAASPDGKVLYVALGDMNAVAVVDAATFTLRGYIPAGWYPSGVAVSADGKRLLVCDAKGSTARIPRFPPQPTTGPAREARSGRRRATTRRSATQPTVASAMPTTQASALSQAPAPNNELAAAVASPTSAPTTQHSRRLRIDYTKLGGRTVELIQGNVMAVDVPADTVLAADTQRVLADAGLSAIGKAPPDIFVHLGRKSGRITHVIYIIKENRSYDQVLGDLHGGDGDRRLAIFGQEVTPNQHALADRFVLMDNMYACGEVSGDGWVWSTQGMAGPYTIRNVPYNYSHRGRALDFEGQNNDYITGGFAARDADGKPSSTQPAFANGAPAIPDVAEAPGGYFWDLAARAGISYRNWGMFLSFTNPKTGPVEVPDNYPTATGLQPPGHDLAGKSDPDYRRFDLDYADSDAGTIWVSRGGPDSCLNKIRSYGKYGCTSRFAEWKREFDLMLAADPNGGTVPTLMLIRLPNDHTSVLTAGKHSPRSAVADNDFAVGQIVEAISHSPIWTSCAIFIVEDDAQNGNDHIDVHRMPALVVSPWAIRHAHDHRFFNTDSVLKTMELILGLGPMTQYDAIADPIDDFEEAPPGEPPLNSEPYDAILPDQSIIAQINPQPTAMAPNDPLRPWVEASGHWDFTRADRAPPELANLAIWKSIKGPDVPMPPERRTLEPANRGFGAILKSLWAPDTDDDDD